MKIKRYKDEKAELQAQIEAAKNAPASETNSSTE